MQHQSILLYNRWPACFWRYCRTRRSSTFGSLGGTSCLGVGSMRDRRWGRPEMGVWTVRGLFPLLDGVRDGIGSKFLIFRWQLTRCVMAAAVGSSWNYCWCLLLLLSCSLLLSRSLLKTTVLLLWSVLVKQEDFTGRIGMAVIYADDVRGGV